MFKSVDIHISGTVQGVGFRPFAYRMAKRNLVNGWVLNAADGVHLHAEGENALVDSFITDLQVEAPAAAQIDFLDVEEALPQDCNGFSIKESIQAPETQHQQGLRTNVSADLATCDDCLRELFDTSDRRSGYPFINCTNCGPRFTIIDALPYDRPATSMRAFRMCDKCASEYTDPSDRRFHAQPNACFDCGPQLSLWVDGSKIDFGNEPRKATASAIKYAAQMLREGKILAIKGLGGYHLACDATNEQAVSTLRKRKHRYGKPLAIMVANIDMARAFCHLQQEEIALLQSSAAPIVLLERRAVCDKLDTCVRATKCQKTGYINGLSIAPSVCDPLHELGVMLPNTPVQHLLMHQLNIPLVMTSGNISEEPIVWQNDVAHERLRQVADAFLDNNRPIVSRYDDSVARVINGRTQIVRRARGYAPTPVAFPEFGHNLPAILATGPQLKNTFTLVHNNQALVSQHIGDMQSLDTLESWEQTLQLYKKLFGIEPCALAYDMHPEYLTSKWAMRASCDFAPQQIKIVQHHHAHIAAVIAENAAAGNCDVHDKVIGVALDGTGLGESGEIWGGEVLLADCVSYQRMAHLQNMTIIGGEQAIKHPARLAFALLARDGLLGHVAAQPLLKELGDTTTALEQMLERRVNCVETSSAGRFLDAMSAILGLCSHASFDGQAPMLLEAAAMDADGHLQNDPQAFEASQRYAPQLVHSKVTSEATEAEAPKPMQIITSPIVHAALDDIVANVPVALVSRRIHNALVEAITDACLRVRLQTGINTVALGGGVMANRIVLSKLTELLSQAGVTVLLPINLPSGDGAISYGQAAVAAARIVEQNQ